MAEQLTPKGWAQLGRSSRVVFVSASTKHLHPPRRPRLKGVSWSPNIDNDALQVPFSIEHEW